MDPADRLNRKSARRLTRSGLTVDTTTTSAPTPLAEATSRRIGMRLTPPSYSTRVRLHHPHHHLHHLHHLHLHHLHHLHLHPPDRGYAVTTSIHSGQAAHRSSRA